MKLIKPTPIVHYTIRDIPGYGSLTCTSSSREPLTSPEAFAFAKKHGGRLQSLAEAIAIRAAFYDDQHDSCDEDYKKHPFGMDGSDESQKTSTISLVFRNRRDILAAFTELDASRQSMRLVKELHDNYHEIWKPVDHPYVNLLIRAAMENGRTCRAHTGDARELSYSTKQTRGKSEYGQSPLIIAAIGNPKIAELHAKHLQKEGRDTSDYVDFGAPKLEELLKLRPNHVRIRHMAIHTDISPGDVSCTQIYARAIIDSGKGRKK